MHEYPRIARLREHLERVHRRMFWRLHIQEGIHGITGWTHKSEKRGVPQKECLNAHMTSGLKGSAFRLTWMRCSRKLNCKFLPLYLYSLNIFIQENWVGRV